MVLKAHGSRPVNDFVLFLVDKALKESQINAIAFKGLITCAIDILSVVEEWIYILKECGRSYTHSDPPWIEICSRACFCN